MKNEQLTRIHDQLFSREYRTFSWRWKPVWTDSFFSSSLAGDPIVASVWRTFGSFFFSSGPLPFSNSIPPFPLLSSGRQTFSASVESFSAPLQMQTLAEHVRLGNPPPPLSPPFPYLPFHIPFLLDALPPPNHALSQPTPTFFFLHSPPRTNHPSPTRRDPPTIMALLSHASRLATFLWFLSQLILQSFHAGFGEWVGSHSGELIRIRLCSPF